MNLEIRIDQITSANQIQSVPCKQSFWPLASPRLHLNYYCLFKNNTTLPEENSKFLYCGELITIKYNHSIDKSILNLSHKSFEIGIKKWKNIYVAIEENSFQILEDSYHFLEKKISNKAQSFQLKYKKFLISKAKTRWGSCNSLGHIRLNWRLSFLENSLIDYVITHELSHLKEMNHSKKFWHIVSQLMPEFKKAQKKLQKINTVPIFISPCSSTNISFNPS